VSAADVSISDAMIDACEDGCQICGGDVFDIRPDGDLKTKAEHWEALKVVGFASQGWALCWMCWDGIVDQLAAEDAGRAALASVSR
jgi:hypothetical protein